MNKYGKPMFSSNNAVIYYHPILGDRPIYFDTEQNAIEFSGYWQSQSRSDSLRAVESITVVLDTGRTPS